MSGAVSTRNTDDDSVVHNGDDIEDIVARDRAVDGAGAEGEGSRNNDCCGDGDRWVSDCVDIHKPDSNRVLGGGGEDDDVVAREINVDGAIASCGGGIGKDC